MTYHAAALHHLREDLPGNVQRLEECVVPAAPVNVVEHGAGGVGGVGDMNGAVGELPPQPTVHRAEEKLSPPGPLPPGVDFVQDPFQLGGGKVGVG